jgi:hypothetical protein
VTAKIHNTYVCLIIVVIFSLLSGCGTSEAKLAATKTKIAADIVATQAAAAPTLTFLAVPTATQTLKPNQKVTLTSVGRATSAAQPMMDLVQQLFNDGYLQSTRGEFIGLGDYEKYLAQLDEVKYFTVGSLTRDLQDFVLRSDIAWKIASENAHMDYSGCGFWFGGNAFHKSFHRVIMTLDGNITLSRCLDCDYLETVVRAYYGELDYMQGEAEMILIVEGDTIQVFLNGKRVIIVDDQKSSRGIFGYIVGSGINTSYGTFCSFTNFEIWDLNP